ncbi:MAG TPA: hypothetical protein VHD76_11620 [Bryobacteraceae bacterium]|jgi:hypothetical protein|nr:hypothetical protein [Bryobacteraceae bacterium]
MEEANRDRLNQELDGLFLQYRDSFPEAAPSATFLPGMWERIERRRQSRFQFTHLSRMFLSGAAAIWLLLAGFLLIPPSRHIRAEHSYVDALASAPDTDGNSFAGVVHEEIGEADSQ